MILNQYLYYLLFSITIFICSYLILKAIIENKFFLFKNLFSKKKSDFNMHSYLIYQNAGLVIIGIFLIISLLLFYLLKNQISFEENIPRPIIFFLSILILYLMSIYDFLKSFHPIFRLLTQIIITFISLTLIEFPLISVQIVPLKIQYISVIFFWVYIINVTNFVDGLDGLIASVSLGFFINLFTFLILFQISSINTYISFLMIPLLASFFIFNKPKARIFLNDVGSIPIGYIIGFCLLNLAYLNEWIIMLSLFFYFIFDVSITLFRKIKKGYYPWARLFDYQFLQPVLKGGQNHSFVLKYIIIYYFLMILTIFFIFYLNLNKLVLLTYSIISSLYIFYKFDKFNLKN